MNNQTSDPRNAYPKDLMGYWELEAAANALVKQGRSLGNRHLRDPHVRAQFNMEVANCAKKIVREVGAGEKSVEEGLQELLKEASELFRQSNEMAAKAAGLIAGFMQISTGVSACRSMPSCVAFGIPLIAHGANNIYENLESLRTGRPGAEGWVRKGYQEVAKVMGYSKREGNIAFAGVDLGLSAYGFGRNVLRPGAWKLFRYVYSDFEKSYRSTGSVTMLLESYVNFQTGKQIHAEVNGG